MEYRNYGIRDQETRGVKGFAVHDSDGMLLFRCGSESDARAKIDRILDPANRGTLLSHPRKPCPAVMVAHLLVLTLAVSQQTALDSLIEARRPAGSGRARPEAPRLLRSPPRVFDRSTPDSR